MVGFVFHSLSREGYRWRRDRPGCPLIAGLGPPSARGCRSDAERCRPSQDARGRIRRRAALLPDPGSLVPEGSGREGQRLARRNQQDRDGGADARRRLPAPPRRGTELDTRGALTRLWDHLKKGQKQRLYGWFQEWADIEAQVTVLRWYEPLVVPGLLQTEDYARAILSARPDGNLDDLDEQVAARLARQAILDRTGAPQLWCILDEGVLHRAIGGSKVMRSQLYRLAEAAEHPKTTIQVIRSSGVHAGLLAHFVIADLDGKPPMVYLAELVAAPSEGDALAAFLASARETAGPGRRHGHLVRVQAQRHDVRHIRHICQRR